MFKKIYFLFILIMLIGCGGSKGGGTVTSGDSSLGSDPGSGSGPEIPAFSCDDYASETSHSAIGGGTLTDPYLICTSTQLYNIGQNSNDWDKHYKLMANVSLAAYTGTQYTPIGTSAKPFTGSFDGNNKVISDFSYDDNPANISYVGIFGYVRGPTFIKDVGLSNINVSGSSAVGGLVGMLYFGVVTNCYVDSGTVQGYGTGSLIGSAQYSFVSYTYSKADVQATGGFTGGLIGVIRYGILRNSYATGDVTNGSDACIGGLVGDLVAGNIENSYATGDVTSNCYRTGGLVGINNNGVVKNSFAFGTVTGSQNGTDVGPLCGGCSTTVNSYYDTNGGAVRCTNLDGGGSCNSTGTGVDVSATGDPNYFYTKTNEPLLSWDFDNEWQDYASAHPTLDLNLLDEDSWGSCAGHQGDSPFAGGVGTFANPYLICTAAQLNTIDTNAAYLDYNYKLMTNISLAAYNSNNFNIIGDTANPFTGTFNGNGKAVADFTYNDNAVDDIGLFGRVRGAFIYGLGVTDVNIIARHNTGAIIGRAANAVGYTAKMLFSTYSTGTISGSNYTGGLIGNADSNFTISASYSSVNVTGGDNVGGLSGYIGYGSYLFGSYASGTVQGNDSVGGLLGENDRGTVSDCYARGEVIGTSVLGGLIGDSGGYNDNSSKVYRSYSTGLVNGGSYAANIGGLIGNNDGSSSGNALIENCYWDVNTSQLGTDGNTTESEGGTGKTTAKMKQQATFDPGLDNTAWDFATVWTITEDSTYPTFRWQD